MTRIKATFFVLFYALFFFLLKNNVYAQGIPVNYIGWYSYNGYHTLNESNKWAIIAEGIIQRDNIIIQPKQWAYRLGLSYELKNNNRFAAGYAFQYNYPYDDVSAPYNSINRRAWEQYSIRKPIFLKNLDRISNRIRLEQVWSQVKSSPDYSTTSAWDFSNILRYQFVYNLPINNKFTASFSEEIFLNMYKFDKVNLLNQNRIYAGMIYSLDKENIWKINAGYMFQNFWNTQTNESGLKRINNVLRISVISDLPLYKIKTQKK